MDLEILGWQNGKANFAAINCWYGFASTTDHINGMEEEAKIILPK